MRVLYVRAREENTLKSDVSVESNLFSAQISASRQLILQLCPTFNFEIVGPNSIKFNLNLALFYSQGLTELECHWKFN